MPAVLKKYLYYTIAIILASVLSISVHVVMLQVLNVPYPPKIESIPVANYISIFCKVLGIFLVFLFSNNRFKNMGFYKVVFIFSLLILAINEDLIRVLLMNILVSKAILYTIIGVLPIYIETVLICASITIFFRYKSNANVLWSVGFIIILSTLFYFIFPVLQELSNNMLTQVSNPDQSKAIQPPYGLNILIPAYLTYLSPVIASFIVYYFMQSKLRQYNTLLHTSLFVIIMILSIGFASGFINAFIAPLFWHYLYSFSQFFLEKILLAILIIASVHWITKLTSIERKR
jgi:hypothetical protein